ncbi:hypothetical protein FJY69_05820 [candidate division WOR-3 bacterium]|nr:hypothetical protein [candidate division WOR-3 bacterium]
MWPSRWLWPWSSGQIPLPLAPRRSGHLAALLSPLSPHAAVQSARPPAARFSSADAEEQARTARDAHERVYGLLDRHDIEPFPG